MRHIAFVRPRAATPTAVVLVVLILGFGLIVAATKVVVAILAIAEKVS